MEISSKLDLVTECFTKKKHMENNKTINQYNKDKDNNKQTTSNNTITNKQLVTTQ